MKFSTGLLNFPILSQGSRCEKRLSQSEVAHVVAAVASAIAQVYAQLVAVHDDLETRVAVF